MTQEQYQNYIKILRSELIPAMGCTEPIAVAFAALKPGKCWVVCQKPWWRDAAETSLKM